MDQQCRSSSSGGIDSGIDSDERSSFEDERRRRLAQLAPGLAHEICTPMQYIGDNARFLAEAAGDLRGILSWYQACLRVLAGKRHPELLEEIAAMERKVDLEHLLAEIPIAIAQSLDGIGRVDALARAFKDFCEAGSEPMAVDVERALSIALAVTQNEWKSRGEFTLEVAEAARIHGPPRDLALGLVEVVLAAAAHCGPPGAAIAVRGTRQGDRIELVFSAANSASSPQGSRSDPCDLAPARRLLASFAASLEARTDGDGWTFHLALPLNGQAGPAAAPARSPGARR